MSTSGAPPLDPVDARLIAFTRVVVGVWAILIAQVDAPHPDEYAHYTLLVLALYTIWSVIVYNAATVKRGSALVGLSHWGDVAWVSVLVALTAGSQSVYFFMFVFAVMVAGFTRGRMEGLAVTTVCTASFALIGWANADLPEFDLNRALMRPMYLLVFGAMTSLWGERELALRRRLSFLRDVGRKWNPSLGRDGATIASLRRLREFFGATKAMLVLQRPAEPPTYCAYLDAAQSDAHEGHVQELDRATARMFLGVAPDAQVVYARDADPPAAPDCERIANFLDTDHFATVPYGQRDGTTGRLFLASARGGCTEDDVDFLGQCADAVAQVLENTRLSEDLVAKAAQKERYHLSLGLHDTTVQPYVGLKLALEGLHREAGSENPLSPRIGQLVEMADATIRDLRGFASELRTDVSMSPQALAKTILHHAERMERFYGVHVDVDMAGNIDLGPYVAAELYCIIAEAFSNIVRHTQSRSAFVRIARAEECVVLSIGNAVAEPAPAFVPRSITERARSIGAACRVETGAYTVVHVEVPS